MALHWFATYLTKKYSKNKKIGLDIGCGKKPYMNFFNSEYVGIDIFSEISNSKEQRPNIFAIGENLPFNDNTFDFITSYSVIPYVEKIDDFISEIYRVMKPKGIAIIIIMNLKALSKDPDGYYPNKFSSFQLEKKFKLNNFKSIKNKNLKTFFWSYYFDFTSVYSYAILESKKSISPNITKDKLFRHKFTKKISKSSILHKLLKKLFAAYCICFQFLHVKPDFLIIGAAKCGTSSLFDYLMMHPQIGKSLTKQIHFFDRYFDRGHAWYVNCFPFIWEKFFHEKIYKKIHYW